MSNETTPTCDPLSSLIADVTEDAALSVCRTTANLPSHPVVKTTALSDIHLDGVGGCVNFAGTLSGGVYLLMSEPLARRITARILGSDKVEMQEIKDVIGELTNQVAGGLKNRLAAAGFESKLTIPTFIRAEKTTIKARHVSISTSNSIRVGSTEDLLHVRVLAKKMA